MKRHAAYLRASAALLLLSAATASATELRKPIRLHMVGELRPALAGKPYQATIRIEALEPVLLSDFALTSPAWQVVSLDAPPWAALSQGDSAFFSFEAIAADVSWPLELRHLADNDSGVYFMDLSPRAIEKATRPGASLSLPRDPSSPAPRGPGPSSSRDGTAGTAGAAAPRTIRVEGLVCYLRTGGVPIPGDEVRIRVYHDACVGIGCVPELLAEAFTLPDGTFDISFDWDRAYDPDLFVEYATVNDKVQVEPFVWAASPYAWLSPTLEDFAGDYYDFQVLVPEDEEDHAALHMHRTLVQGWRWLDAKGYAPTKVWVRWPETGSTNAHWSSGGVIYIPPGTKPGDPDYVNNQRWSEGTLFHEYGHHWLHQFGAVDDRRTYRNGVCDQPGNPRHCDWCAETIWDAWNEGFSDWFGDVIPRSLSPAPWSSLNRETHGDCIEGGAGWSPPNPSAGAACPCAPEMTEGPVSAVLRDIEDPDADDDPAYPGWQDALAEPPDEILRIASIPYEGARPDDILEFLRSFAASRPEISEDLWETGMNNGFDIDTVRPPLVSGIASSHDWTRFAGEDDPDARSPDPTVDFTWTRPGDLSGVEGYSISISPNAAVDPDLIVDIGDVTSFTSDPLAPGKYYFNIWVQDRSGKWAAAASHHGPFYIRDAEPSDLAPYLFAEWADRVVPRDAADASGASCPAPATLPGNAAGTYWNASGRNEGDDPTSVGFEAHLYVDGAPQGGAAFPPVVGHGTYHTVNQGPLSVRGGRHTFSVIHDGAETISEGDETNNVWGRQWIWTPLMMTPGVQETRNAPPEKDGGWAHIRSGGAAYFNCDGLRIHTGGGDWHAVWIHASKDANDYDCRLHAASTGATNGFAANVGYSSRGAGRLDAVIVNRSNTGGAADWDVGVIAQRRVTDVALGAYRAKHVVDQDIPVGAPVAVEIPDGEMLVLREFRILPGDVGPVTITVEADPADGPIHAVWLADDFTTGDIGDDYDGYAVTDAEGRARIDFVAAGPGYNCLVLFRDPEELTSKPAPVALGTAGAAAGAVSLTVEVKETPPDFTPYAAPGWYGPLVPRDAPDGTPTSTPPPASLPGDVASTYLNLAVRNDSPSPASAGVVSRVYLDGVALWEESWPAFPASAYLTINSDSAQTVRGGRHTLTLRLDEGDGFGERDETNNVSGEQWIWAPPEIPTATGVSRAAPPDPTGSLEDLTGDEPFFYNCDGLRTPPFAPDDPHGYWGAVAALPGPGGDVDLRLHEIVPGAKAGFGPYLALSAWGPERSDYLLVNFRYTVFRAFDIGVLGSGAGSGYRAEVVSSAFRSPSGSGGDPVLVGPLTLDPGRILELHEFALDPGSYEFRLENLGGAIDWGIALHGGNEIYFSKTSAYQSGEQAGIAWLGGPGADESFVIQIDEAGFYCVAVWKARSADRDAAGKYRLHVVPRTVDVSETPAPGAAVALTGPWPNPMRHAASVRLRLPRDGRVRIALYDTRGARVRVLADASLPAGEHEVTWNGRDESARRVRPGVYQLRVDAGGHRASRKIVVLK